MWRYDFHLFYMGARAILEGSSPYQLWDFNGPYPLAIFFIPFALLPESLAYFVFLAINLVLTWKVLGLKRGIWPLISFPVVFCLFVGQIDLMLTLLVILGSPWTLGLLIIKPQVGLILAPWFLRRLSFKGYIKMALVAVPLIGISFMLSPNWVQEWLAGSPGMELYAGHASNIYWLLPEDWKLIITLIGASVVFVICIFINERRLSWTLMTLFAPLTNIYTPSVLAEWIGPLEVVISWIAIFLVGGRIHSGTPEFLIMLSILFRIFYEKRLSLKN